ncbi:hypothetical protein ACEPAH_7478 [Sanghuangporus vaninii]
MHMSLSISVFLFVLSYGFSGPRLKRVIYTSSDVAHFSPRPKGFYNESNFNDERTVEVPITEKSAWSFVSDHKPDITWDLSVVRPIYVFGPVLQEANSPADLSISSAMVYDALVANDKRPTLQNFSPINCDWVDVRDAALDHVHNIEVPVAGKDMFILSSGPFIWQDLLDVANELKIPGTNALVRNPGFSKTYPFDMV